MKDNALPVSIHTMVTRDQGVTIYYPQVVGLADMNIQAKVNQTIIHEVQQLIYQQYEQQDVQSFTEMIGTFELKTNERNVLSLTFSNYAFAEYHAHGLTLMTSLTFDMATGKVYKLNDLFKGGSDYKAVLTRLVKQQIKERDIPIINDDVQISSNTGFYIADKALVIYFQAYEITPGYVGIPMFPISVFTLQDMVTEEGPLGRMMSS